MPRISTIEINRGTLGVLNAETGLNKTPAANPGSPPVRREVYITTLEAFDAPGALEAPEAVSEDSGDDSRFGSRWSDERDEARKMARDVTGRDRDHHNSTIDYVTKRENEIRHSGLSESQKQAALAALRIEEARQIAFARQQRINAMKGQHQQEPERWESSVESNAETFVANLEDFYSS